VKEQSPVLPKKQGRPEVLNPPDEENDFDLLVN
jgi:hypothetical protein